MRISDWSSDVCSSDLHDRQADQHGGRDQESLAPHRSEGLSEAEIHLEAVVGIPWVEGKGEVGTDRPDRRVIAEAEAGGPLHLLGEIRSEEHTSELQSLMRISYAVFCLKKKTKQISTNDNVSHQLTSRTSFAECTQI